MSVLLAVEVCHWLESCEFDSLAARMGSAVWVELAAEECRWFGRSAFDSSTDVDIDLAVSVVLVAEEHRPASEWCDSGWQAAAVFE